MAKSEEEAMKNSKRKFLKNGLALGLGLPLVSSGIVSCIATEKAPKLKILILGGTSFLGPHQVAYALSRGHEVSTFTRGKTKPTIHQDVFDQVEMLIGDREDNLTALENREWDLVIDNSGRKAEWTQRTAQLLKDKVGQYVYISSTGVYYPYLEGGIDENTKVSMVDPVDPNRPNIQREDSYGVMKAKSEQETIKAFGTDRSIVVRPTYMVGPGDKTDRFIYWPVRLARGGEIMVPGKSEDPMQYVDVRDVAEWTIRLGEEKKAGTYNAVGPQNAQTLTEFIDKAKEAFNVESTFVSIDDYAFLRKNRVSFIIPWIMPNDEYYGSARIKNDNAKKAGLTFRPLKDTVKETYDWWVSDALPAEHRDKYESNPRGMLLREEAILEEWIALKG